MEGVESKQSEARPAAVPARATQAGDLRARWAWIEPTVWTERMLAALEHGVRGGTVPTPALTRTGCTP